MMQCLPQNVAKPRIIRRSRHHWRKPTSFAEGKHHSKNAPLSVDKSAFFVDLPDRIRTCDLKSRSLARYPAMPRVVRALAYYNKLRGICQPKELISLKVEKFLFANI